MEKIIDLFGYNANEYDMYDAENSWYGTVLVGEDNWFEGVVREYCDEDYSLVFGHMTEETLDVIKVAPEDQHVAKRYEGLKDGKKFYGMYMAKALWTEIPIGECKMSLLPAETTREETDMERAYVHKKINIMADRLGEMGTLLYQDFQTQRRKMQEK